ncbi:MAG: TonB-dependent receptor [Gammaproteobacteria bacterium]|nr:MAG: TonB-dependent receptor [Gammaproteobacteria bacterium]
MMALAGTGAHQAASAQQAAGSQRQQLDEIVVTGTRTEGRTALQSLAPVDLLSAADLEAHGSTELNTVLSYSLPSFNFPNPAINDGTDSIRPAQLRGLSPDQTLVLVNGKRRHTSALLNLNQVGRGAAAVDLNTIPTAAVGALEVLRDGASAQYGSDAIAGVINVRLREAREGGGVTLTYGEHLTEFKGPRSTRNIRDGETVTLGAWAGLPLGAEGFLTVSGEYRDRSNTNRAELDTVFNYPLQPDGSLDPRETQFNRLNWRQGLADVRDVTLMLNAGLPINPDLELYGFASYQDRDSTSVGFYRRARDARNVPEIYPNGFLPQINPEITDLSMAGGARGEAGEWGWDASIVYGSNEVDWNIRNSLNRSLGVDSPTEFDAGSLKFEQTVLNVDAARALSVAAFTGPLNVAFGAEYRNERFKIGAGEPDSYFGAPGFAAGSQVFPGYAPQNAVSESRDSFGLYVDLEADITDRFIGSAALRFEDYSDFGSTLNAKLAARLQATDAVAVRGAVSTGFRAPSLHQSHFQATATVVSTIDGALVFNETGTFAVDSDIARALGSQPLDAEEALNISLGMVVATGGLVLTVDAYRIEIDDRVLLSENLGGAARPDIVALLPEGITQARFFLNAADSRTTGIDAVASYAWEMGGLGEFNATAAANWNKTTLSNLRSTGVLSELDPPPTVFARENVLRQEEGAPRNKYILGLDWSRDDVSAFVRATRFGSVLIAANNPASDWTIDSMWVVDVEGTVGLTERLSVSLGANNLFDQYPTQNPFFNAATGPTPFVFSAFSPAGFSGRYVYARARYSW